MGNLDLQIIERYKTRKLALKNAERRKLRKKGKKDAVTKDTPLHLKDTS